MRKQLNRTEYVVIRSTKEWKEMLKAKAKKARMTQSDYVRMAVEAWLERAKA